MGAVTPETCRVVLQWINVCILLHLLDFYSHWITMHGTTGLKFCNVGLSHGSVCAICDNADRIKEIVKPGTKVFV